MTTFLAKDDVTKTREINAGDPAPVHGMNPPPGPFPAGNSGAAVVRAPASGWRTRIKAHVLAVLLTLTALFIRLAIGVKPEGPDGLELFLIPIVLSAYLGGLGPGLLATLLSAALADYFLIPPFHSFSLRMDLLSAEWSLLVITGVLVSVLSGSFHRSRKRLQFTLARRDRTENELQWKSAFLEAQLDSSNDGILVVDDHGKKLYQNAQMSALWRIPREIADDPDDRRQIDFVGQRVSNPAQFVAKIVHLNSHPDEKSHDEIELIDGTVLDRFSHPVIGRDGARYGRIWTFRDVTARRQAEAATRESEERLSHIAATVPGVIYEFRMRPDGTFCFPYASPSIEKVFGFKPGELLQDAGPAFQMIQREDLPGLVESIQESARTLAPWSYEFRVQHASRGEIWIEGASTPEREADGGTLWHGFLHDVTQRKLAQESHARLATAVEQAAEAIVITDPAGAILYVNPAFETVSGYPREEVLGQNPRVLKSGKHASEFYRQMWNALRQGKSWSSRITNKRKDGTLYEEEMSISAVRNSAGKVVNYVAVKRDVSREASLEAQFRQAQKMEAIGQLAGGVAHDFNNILTVIQGNAGLLRDNQLPPAERVECSNEIVLAADRAASLTRQLLVFSRKQVIQPVNLNLNQVITGTIKMLQRILGEDIVLQSEFAPKLPPILADAGMIEQVLLNLAVNSRDAMPNGGRLVITTSAQMLDENQARQNAEAAPGPHVRLSVSDTGAGIPPEVLPRIFEPFFTTKEVGKGTGLGLATVHGIVKQHHGWIEVDSKPGGGTTFNLWFPAVETRPAAATPAAPPADLPRGHETILVAEDDASLRQLVAGLLKRCGYTVLQAPSGPAALKIWQENKSKVELLLTDVVMPDGMNGFNLAKTLLAEQPGLKVLYTSGYTARTANDVHCVEGVNFLQKPYSPVKLAELVRECLHRD